MDILLKLWYSWVRETRRLCPTITGAAHEGGCAFKARPLLSSCGPRGSVIHKFVGALDAKLPAQRQGWLEAAPDAGPSAGNVRSAEAGVDRLAKAGSMRGRLLHRDVDHPAGRRANPTALGHKLPSGARLENSDRPGLELPEARTPGHSTQPQENPAMEAARLAAYKKKHGGCALIWCSSMKAGSCSFRRCCALGRRWAAPRCCGTAIAASVSRLLEA